MQFTAEEKQVNGRKIFLYDNIFTDEEIEKIKEYIIQTKKKQGFIYVKEDTLDEKVLRYIWRKLVKRIKEVDGHELRPYSEGGVAPVMTITNNNKPIGVHIDKPLEEMPFKIKMGKVMYKLIVYVQDGIGTRFHKTTDKRRPAEFSVDSKKGRVCLFDIRIPHSGCPIKPGQRKLLIGMRPILQSKRR